MRWLITLLKSKLKSDQALQPSDQSYRQLLYRVKVAYLTMKIGIELNFSMTKRNRLFFHIMKFPGSLTAHREAVVAAAAYLLEWSGKGEDIPEKMSQYSADQQVIRAMQAVYFKEKDELFSSPSKSRQLASHSRQDIWYVYRDVLAAATKNRLLLIKEAEVEYFKEGTLLLEGRILERADISKVRNDARRCFEARQFSKSAVMSFLLVLSEAMTNVFKHASHGSVMIVEKDGQLHLIVEDAGTGIPLEQLPMATLHSGYSTQNSLGQGFTVMLKIASCLHLHTSEKGSSLVITFDGTDQAERGSDQEKEQIAQVWGV